MKELDWGLFGVNEKSTVKELKDAFFNIALITHPDKNQGVTKDEFSYVLDQYKNIKNFLQKIENNDNVLTLDTTVDLKDIENNHIKNEDTLVREIPSFMSIYEEVHDNYKIFNKIFEDKKNNDTENNDVWNASHSLGYIVEKSEYVNLLENDFNNISLKYTSLSCEKNNLNYSHETVIKKNTIIDISQLKSAHNNNTIPYADLNINDTLQIYDNFTTHTHIDYIDAFKQPCFLEDTLPSDTLEKFKAQEIKKFENIEYSPFI
jgi:hypothetical protein